MLQSYHRSLHATRARRLVAARGARLALAFLLLVAFALLAVAGGGAVVRAQDGMFYQQYDVNIALQEDGSYTVRSVQTIRFDDEYNTAFLEIPVDHASEITNVQVWQQAPRFTNGPSLLPLDVSVTRDGDTLYVDWEYETTLAGELRTFVIDYTVLGGVWVYDDFDVLQWFAINTDRSGLPVFASEISMELPDAVAAAAAEGLVTASVVSGNGEASIQGDRVFFLPEGGLADGEGFEVALEFPHGLLPVSMQGWQRAQAEADAVAHIPVLDVQIAVQADGLVDVTESIDLAVDEGRVFSGYRTIRTLYQDEIQNVRVFQNGRPLPRGVEGCEVCFTADYTPSTRGWARWDAGAEQVVIDDEAVGTMAIRWWTEAIAAGESARFEVRYTVVGGVRVGDANQVINFDVLPDYGMRIDASTLQVQPPPGVSAAQIAIESGAAQSEPEITAEGALQVRNRELPATGARWQVLLTLPAGATSAAMPTWQQEFEQSLAFGQAQAAEQARRVLGTRAVSLLAVVAAVGASVWAWLRFGRTRTREMLKGYVSEPPSTLAPGIVAYLLDRKASEKGMLASLFQLAVAGLIDVDLSSGIQIRRLVDEPLVAKPRKNAQGDLVPIAHHQAAIFNDVLIPHAPLNQFVTLDGLAGPLRAALSGIFAKMGDDAQAYFVESAPSGGGASFGCLGSLAAIAALVGAVALLAVSGFDGATLTFLVIAGFALVVLAVVVAMRRPFGGQRRSASGEAEAEKWLKFRNYLLNLKEYGDLGAAQEIIDRYFPYAVALGAEKVVLAQAEAMGAQLPPWIPMPTYHPYQLPNLSGNTAQESNQGGALGNEPLGQPMADPRPLGQPMPSPVASSAPQASSPRPSLTGMSAAMGESLGKGSSNLGRTLTVAAGGAAATTVVLNSRLRQRTMQFDNKATPNQMLDDIMRQSLSDARTITSRPTPTAPGSNPWRGSSGSGGSGGSFWGGGGSSSGSSSGSSRSSGGFGGSSSRSSWSGSSSSRSSSSSSRSSSSSSSRSSSSSSRSSSSGGGRSGFGKR